MDWQITGEESWEGVEPPRALAQAREVIARVFAVASISRWLPLAQRRAWRTALACRDLRLMERRSFWLRLLAATHLFTLGPDSALPTQLFAHWLEKPLFDQVRDLAQAWAEQPASLHVRRARRRILQKLSDPAGTLPLTGWEARAAQGLRRLKLLSGGLTPLGRVILRGEVENSIAAEEMLPWQHETFTLHAWAQEDFSLLWQLEQYLLPYAPDQYLLTPAALRSASQRGDMEELVSIIERGTERPLSPEISARILNTPAARVRPGQVLEFDSPDELAALRSSPALRRRLDPLLSPRHVLLAPCQAEDTLKSLRRAGIPIFPLSPPIDPPGSQPSARSRDLPAGATGGKLAPGNLALGEFADLYCLALAAAGSGMGVSLSPELIAKLERLLPEKLRRAAAARGRQAAREHEKGSAAPWRPPDDCPSVVPQNRIEVLQSASERGETIPVWYRAAGRAAWERRRLTPLLIERRGARLLLTAYCHDRRANRTFRLDRLVLENEGWRGPAP